MTQATLTRRALLLGAALLAASCAQGPAGAPRDHITLDGPTPAPGIPAGVPAVAVSRVTLPATPQRAVAGEFNGERIVGRNWPAADNHVVALELHD